MGPVISKPRRQKRLYRQAGSGLTICENARLKPEVFEILEVMADSNAILATGHVSNSEALVLVREAAAAGIKRILVNHPEDKVSAISEAEQRELIKHGGLILEKCLITTMRGWGDMTIKLLSESVRNLGGRELCDLLPILVKPITRFLRKASNGLLRDYSKTELPRKKSRWMLVWQIPAACWGPAMFQMSECPRVGNLQAALPVLNTGYTC